MFNWLARDLFQINTALVAHHKRTGKDISRWYGNHFPNARIGPIEKAARTPHHCPSHQTTAAQMPKTPEPSPRNPPQPPPAQHPTPHCPSQLPKTQKPQQFRSTFRANPVTTRCCDDPLNLVSVLLSVFFDRGIFAGDGFDPKGSGNDRLLVLFGVRAVGGWGVLVRWSGRGRFCATTPEFPSPPPPLLAAASNRRWSFPSFGSSSRGLVQCVQGGVSGGLPDVRLGEAWGEFGVSCFRFCQGAIGLVSGRVFGVFWSTAVLIDKFGLLSS